MLAAEVLGQLGILRGLDDVLRELAERTARPRQAHALLLHLREQALCDFPLNGNPPDHGISHLLASNNNGRVSHNHLLSNQARPPHTTTQAVPFGQCGFDLAGDGVVGVFGDCDDDFLHSA